MYLSLEGRVMDFKIIGSILLIVGTSIGAGMLALPIATAQLGFIGSLILLVVCWSVMTAGAFLILEVNLWMPQNSNLISMAKATMGPVGQIISWVFYLLLLYSLLCAYISGGSGLFHNLLLACHFDVSQTWSSIIFTLLFGLVVFLGIRSIDYVNRGLMFVKLGAYILLIILLTPFISTSKLFAGDLSQLTATSAMTVTITSFGYASIIPSLRIYFASDLRKLKIAIIIGSLVPLICYAFWDAIIMGVIPLDGANGLITILHSSKNSTSDLVNTLSATASKESITIFARLFTSICVVTSFLGVSLCLTDFLSDGLNLTKQGNSNLFLHALTFLPPLIIVIFFPNAFIKALEYAGIYCIILLILLPAWMAWMGRYRRHLAKASQYQFFGGKTFLLLMMIFGVAMLIKSMVN